MSSPPRALKLTPEVEESTHTHYHTPYRKVIKIKIKRKPVQAHCANTRHDAPLTSARASGAADSDATRRVVQSDQPKRRRQLRKKHAVLILFHTILCSHRQGYCDNDLPRTCTCPDANHYLRRSLVRTHQSRPRSFITTLRLLASSITKCFRYKVTETTTCIRCNCNSPTVFTRDCVNILERVGNII